MGNIGEPLRRIELEPLSEPAPAEPTPTTPPTPVPSPAEPEKVPA